MFESFVDNDLQYVSYLQDKISNFMEKRLNNNMVIYTKLNLQIQSLRIYYCKMQR